MTQEACALTDSGTNDLNSAQDPQSLDVRTLLVSKACMVDIGRQSELLQR